MDDIHEQGRCLREGRHELFFSDEPGDLAAAQEICARCAVRIPCLEQALSAGVDWGVWGGVIFIDGQAFHRKRGRGRPRRGDGQRPLKADLDELWGSVRPDGRDTPQIVMDRPP